MYIQILFTTRACVFEREKHTHEKCDRRHVILTVFLCVCITRVMRLGRVLPFFFQFAFFIILFFQFSKQFSSFLFFRFFFLFFSSKRNAVAVAERRRHRDDWQSSATAAARRRRPIFLGWFDFLFNTHTSRII